MSHIQEKVFCLNVQLKYPEAFRNKRVLDVGSLDVNGCNKYLFKNCEYIGLDLSEGKNVDIISIAHEYNAPDESFDTIISTECFEHDMFYKKTIQNIIRLLKPGGLFLFTCATDGRAEHGTRKHHQWAAPLLIKMSEEWADYYKNLSPSDFQKIEGFQTTFPNGKFEFGNFYYGNYLDLYFYGIKEV